MSVKLLLVSLLAQAFCEDILVELPNGVILGRQDESYTGKPYYIFQKIPYAAPPIGELRFKASVPPSNWDGVLNCTYLDKVCYQINTNLPEESEDCLYINVYTPQLPGENKDVSIPVLLYIHGGGFTDGHAIQYRLGPEYLIDHDVVIVTFNYRLGPLGFLSTGDEVILGNNGLKDQHLAIKWVHDNIHSFGGDPAKVTIVGESAGGASVSHQLLHKKSEGLFRGAIMESGTAIHPWSFQRYPKETAFKFGTLFNESFAENTDSKILLNYLLSVPAEDLDKKSESMITWAPVIEQEHVEAFLTKKMYGLIRNGDFVKVPILMGMNSEESLGEAADLHSLNSRSQQYDSHMDDLVPDDVKIVINNETVIKFGQKIKQLYVGDRNFTDNLGSTIRFMSDDNHTRPAIRCAEMKSQYTDVYFYQFSYDGLMGNVSVSIEGAEHVAHAEDLRYIWRTTRDGYDNSDLSKFPPEDVTTQHRMLTLWTNFVKTLNPTPETIDLLQNVTWPKTTAGGVGDFLYLDINENLEVNSHPKKDTYHGWIELYAMLNYDDFDTF